MAELSDTQKEYEKRFMEQFEKVFMSYCQTKESLAVTFAGDMIKDCQLLLNNKSLQKGWEDDFYKFTFTAQPKTLTQVQDEKILLGFGRYIKAARVNRGLTYKQMEKKTNIDAAFFSAIENGIYPFAEFSKEWLIRIANILNLDVNDLYLMLRIPSPTSISKKQSSKDFFQNVVAVFKEVVKEALITTEGIELEPPPTSPGVYLSYELLRFELNKVKDKSKSVEDFMLWLNSQESERVDICTALTSLSETALYNEPIFLKKFKSIQNLGWHINKVWPEGVVNFIVQKIRCTNQK